MKKELIVFILIIFMIISLIVLVPMVKSQVRINEVMPKTPEWIEIYNPLQEELNLSKWQIGDSASIDQITCWNISNCSLVINSTHFLIIGRDTNINDIINSPIIYFYVDDQKIGSGLNDGGDNITLYNSSHSLMDNITYPSIPENKTWAFFNNEWQVCSTPTPGKENNCQEPEPELECQTDADCNENEICENEVCVADENEEESSLEITDYDDEATFGDVIDVKLNIYRGDTGKYAVYVRVEDESEKDVSEESILHILTKYVDYKVKIPIQLKMNCNEKYDEDTYFIIVEGLDEKITEEIKISGKSSECENEVGEEVILEQSFEANEINEENETKQTPTNAITGQTVVESEGSTVLKITPYLLALLSLFIALYIIKIK